MRLRLPLLCAALIGLAACGGGNNDAAPASTPAPAATAPAATPATPAPASTAPATSAPAASGTAATAAAPAPAPAPADDANDTRPAPKPFVDDGKWVEGKHYFRIDPAQPTSSPGKIEVTEVFSYGCPACFQYHGVVDDLAKNLPRGTVMTYTPASFRPDENWPLLQRAYLTAQAFGVDKQSHDAVFDAVFKSGELGIIDLKTNKPKAQSAWPTIDDVAKFYAKYGVKPEEFAATANSFTINTKMKRADELIRAYEVDSTPTIVVNGKYRLTPNSAGGYAQSVELVQWLISKEAAGK
ncbi:thiol:disulfide interchange protein DsbA/DsbL [Luteibacter aegosomatissinici]|uniref:thiol:disulfide interchange protein DsbA/DsbL n=1 Tax=Luteibacter aegosomatissinici TaxID=2911539 RepID=UPI001FFC2897|nr:thiol:disulfide interchange protein DsbA/DsbL [Luteibacter aegosomatissinici]UPG94090.1 thiol:disulfide interchange protein DsbA/DsbL [Luteibacter aegosomatissinici]